MARHDFSDKVALVTGAGGGIGRAACIEFARAGAALACVDVDAGRAQATAAAVRDLGGRAIALVADVTDAAAVERYVADTLVAFGRIDAFANNAGYQGRLLPLVDYPDDEFDRVIAINLRGAYLGLKHVLRVMLRQGSGAVVNTGSIGSFIGYGGLCAYAASKHALIGLSKSAALSVAKTGIRVNTVCPGGTETEMIRAIEAALPRDEAARMISAIPDGRRAWPEEIARTILFLASDDASHITGQSLVIDGGRLAG